MPRDEDGNEVGSYWDDEEWELVEEAAVKHHYDFIQLLPRSIRDLIEIGPYLGV
jgi:hypothetical protein